MIKFNQVDIRAGDFRLKNISFVVEKGDYAVLMGQTGSGKTTILEALCGLKRVTGGRIFLDYHDLTNISAAARGIGFVPQEATLFSTMTVRKHLSFGPSVQKWDKKLTERRVAELAEQLGITEILDRKPHGLSGGERQRVSLGRALAIKPKVLCLDEPLSALDDETHTVMTELIKNVVAENSITALHVTHSETEAAKMADCRFYLKDGIVDKA